MTTYNLTQRPANYPHSQIVAQTPVKTVSARFSGPDATVVKGSALATTNVFELINVPAGAFVISVAHKVITAEGGTCTYEIGDGSDTDGYVVAATSGNGNTTTNAQSFNATTTPGYGVGKLYTAADTIDLYLTSGTAATVVIDVSVTYIQTLPLAV